MDYEISDEYTELAHRIIRTVPALNWIAQTDIQFCCLKSYKEKKSSGKTVYGECIRVPELYRPFCPYDFLIVIYEINCVSLSENQLKILLQHELMHINLVKDKPEIRPHDIEDFAAIINTYGQDWAAPGKAVPDILEDGG